MSDWQHYRLADICVESEGVQTGPFVSQLHQKDYVDYGTPIITVEHLGDNRITTQNLPMVSDKDRKRLAKYTLREGDIVFSRVGSVDRRALVRNIEDGWLFSGRCLRVRVNRKIVNPSFISFLFGTEDFKEHIRSIAVGATMPSINTKILSNVSILLPPIRDQNEIASVLGALDDKIELNRQTNETLEALSRVIFKDWFVDFGPTRAKTEGREPYLAPEIWDLFPNALDDEDKPEGWTQGTLASIADSPRRGVSPAEVAEETPYIGLEHMPRRSIALTEWDSALKVTSNKSIFKKGEFLFGKLRPYFHKVGIAPFDGICSTDIVVVIPRSLEWSAYTIACLSSEDFVTFTDKTSTGTKMPRTSWNTMGQYKVILPPEGLACAFQGIVQPLLEGIDSSIHESRTLAQTRDLLLPKLMSGEIRLKDAESIVGGVA